MTAQPFFGLTSEQVEKRFRQGQSNRKSGRDQLQYAQIVFGNIFTLFNAIVVPAAIALLLLHDVRGAIAVSGMAIVNTSIGLFQEIVTKRRLEKLIIRGEPKVRVLRDGQIQEMSSRDVVLGDHLLLAAGEMVVADGSLLDAKFLEMDEALLTGESDPVRRNVGDNLLSGGICVTGEGVYQVDRVGDKTHASQTGIEARHYRYKASSMTRMINRLVKILSFTAIGLHFPFLPEQVTLLNVLSINLPAFTMALNRRQASGGSKNTFFYEVGWFALRTGILFGIAGLITLWLSVHSWQETLETQRTLLLSTLIMLGLTAMIRASTDGESAPRMAFRIYYLLALVCLSLYFGSMYFPPSANFFQLTALSLRQWTRVIGVVVVAHAVCKVTDRLSVEFWKRTLGFPQNAIKVNG